VYAHNFQRLNRLDDSATIAAAFQIVKVVRCEPVTVTVVIEKKDLHQIDNCCCHHAEHPSPRKVVRLYKFVIKQQFLTTFC
jgi:hypothetical protein